jgi:osmotically-inducible protein OsmY
MLAQDQSNLQVGEFAPCRPGTAEAAADRLRASGHPALRNVNCEYHAGTLTLRACLPSYYLRQVALAVVADLEGVERVQDQIEVLNPGAGRHRD